MLKQNMLLNYIPFIFHNGLPPDATAQRLRIYRLASVPCQSQDNIVGTAAEYSRDDLAIFKNLAQRYTAGPAEGGSALFNLHQGFLGYTKHQRHFILTE